MNLMRKIFTYNSLYKNSLKLKKENVKLSLKTKMLVNEKFEKSNELREITRKCGDLMTENKKYEIEWILHLKVIYNFK